LPQAILPQGVEAPSIGSQVYIIGTRANPLVKKSGWS